MTENESLSFSDYYGNLVNWNYARISERLIRVTCNHPTFIAYFKSSCFEDSSLNSMLPEPGISNARDHFFSELERSFTRPD